MRHWIDQLPEGPGVRYKRILLEKLEKMMEERRNLLKALSNLTMEIDAEEKSIVGEIMKEWSANEINTAMQQQQIIENQLQ